MDTGPILGGIALAAVLAAVISSGAPILLASATMFVNDWIPAAKEYDSDRKLRAYKIVTVLYGTAAAVIAWLGNISSVLQLLLLGFAMVVPRLSRSDMCFTGGGQLSRACSGVWRPGLQVELVMWLFNTLFGGAENATAGGFAQAWYELITFLGEWRDPSFLTLMLPLIVIPAVSLMGSRPDGDEEELSLSMSGWVASSETSTGPEFFTVSCLPESEMVPGSHSFSPAVCRSHQPTALWPRVRRTLGKIYPVDFGLPMSNRLLAMSPGFSTPSLAYSTLSML